jgi:hypothetical protein
MIILIFIMVSMIAIPMAVEKVRSPKDNLASDVKEEVAETIIRPLEIKVEDLRTRAMAWLESAATATLVARLLKLAIDFVLGLVQTFLKFLD